jgi:NAD(P) transhydrogenase subunit alpha
LIPYKKAPNTITDDHVKSMKSGSVIVDLAAVRGGTCELTDPGKTVVKEGVTLVGDLNWPSTLGINASEMYSGNVLNTLLVSLNEEGQLIWVYEDDIVDGAMICHAGEEHHPKLRELLGLPPLQKEPEPGTPDEASAKSGAPATGTAANEASASNQDKPADAPKPDAEKKEQK